MASWAGQHLFSIMELGAACLQEDFEAAPCNRNNGRKRLESQVTDSAVFLEIHEESIHAVSDEHFLPRTVFVPELLPLDLLFPFLRLLDKQLKNIELGLVLEIEIYSFAVLGFQPL